MNDPLSNACAALAKSNALLIQVTQERDELKCRLDNLQNHYEEACELCGEATVAQAALESDMMSFVICALAGELPPLPDDASDIRKRAHHVVLGMRKRLDEVAAERDMYRDALRCERCEGTGRHHVFSDRGHLVSETCPECAEARTKARGV